MIIRAIEVGYGTLSFTSGVIDDKPVITTFPSVVAPVSAGNDLSGGFSKRDTIRVTVGNNTYEVGPDAHLLTDRISSRVLNNAFIESDQYQALLKGALYMINQDVIDLLVLSLPVTNMHRAEELKGMVIGEREINGKKITIKNAWVLCQPLAGYMCYANQIGQERFNALKDVNVLSIDFGFSTVDWLTSRGLKINDRRSGAVNMGMSAVLEETQKSLKGAFPHLDTIPLHLIDNSFWKNPGEIQISGRSYPFPICDGKLKGGEETRIRFDASAAIKSVSVSALQEVRNSVGAGADINLVLVMGGPNEVYLDSVKKTFPEHEVIVVEEPITAVCRGMYYGGVQYAKAISRKSAA